MATETVPRYIQQALTPMPRVPTWVNVAAILTALLPLPVTIWRLALGFGYDVGFTGSLAGTYQAPGWLTLYVIALCALNEGAAYLTLGLVRPWGERWPRWIPFRAGKRIHPLTAIVPATLGAATLALIIFSLAGEWSGAEFIGGPEAPQGWKEVWMTLSYAPLLAWPFLLALVTAAYAYRRRHEFRAVRP